MPGPMPHGGGFGGMGPGGWGRLIGGLVNPYGGMMPYNPYGGYGYNPYVQRPIFVPTPVPAPVVPVPMPPPVVGDSPTATADGGGYHPDLTAALDSAVSDGRITAQQATIVKAFVADHATAGAINWQTLLAVILPILEQVFPQIGGLSGIIAIIESLFNGGVTPVPVPTPTPAPVQAGNPPQA